MLRRRGLLTVVLLCALVLAVGRAWGALIGDHAWFDSLGFVDIWWWQTSVALLLKFSAGAVATLAMRAHLEAVRRSFVSVVVPETVGDIELTNAVSDRTISAILWIASFALGVLLTLLVDEWIPLARVLDAQPFGESDPYFQQDLAFWVYWLPVERQAYSWTLVAHAIMASVTVVGYVLTRGIGTEGNVLRITRHARRHVTLLGAILLVLIAWSYRLDGFDRLVHGTGAGGAFGFADHRVGLPGVVVMQVVSLGAAGLVLWSAWSRQPRTAVAAVTTVLLMALLLRQGTPLLADSVDGGGDSVARERRYAEAGASFTRRAYEADRVIGALESDTASVSSAPLWDRATLPYTAPGRVGAVLAWDAGDGMPAATVFDALPGSARLPTWRATSIDAAAADPFARVGATAAQTLPPIVVSDSGRGYALVSDPAGTIAAPDVSSRSARLAFAWNQQNPRLLFGKLPTPAAVLVTVRDVRERVARLAPTLAAGAFVVPIVHQDSLLWSVDLYATSATYPLSEHVVLNDADVAAAQFAATALVNAHTGRVSLVVEPAPPLLAQAALSRYARHLVPLSELPESLRRALPPRADGLAMEGAVAARYGSQSIQKDSASFIRRGATLRNLSLVGGVPADSSVSIDGFVPVWFPERRVYALTTAAIDVSGVIRGVLMAPGGTDRRIRWRPATDAAPYVSVIRPAEDATDSLHAAGTLTGARRGSTRVLPGPTNVRFLTPYFRLRDGRPSALTGVLITDGRRRGIAPTVPEAALIMRDGVPGAPASLAGTIYRQMRDALQRGAWVEFGASFDALGRALNVPREPPPP